MFPVFGLNLALIMQLTLEIRRAKRDNEPLFI